MWVCVVVSKWTAPVLSSDDSCERRGQYPQSSQQSLPGGSPVQGSQDESTAQWVVGQNHSGHPSESPYSQLEHEWLVWLKNNRTAKCSQMLLKKEKKLLLKNLILRCIFFCQFRIFEKWQEQDFKDEYVFYV